MMLDGVRLTALCHRPILEAYSSASKKAHLKQRFCFSMVWMMQNLPEAETALSSSPQMFSRHLFSVMR